MISGSSLVSSPTNRTSTSRVRGPQRTSRVRAACRLRRAARARATRAAWRPSPARSPGSRSRPGRRRPPARSRRRCDRRYASSRRDDRDAAREVRAAVTDVGAERQVRESHYGRATCSARRPWRRPRRPVDGPCAPRRVTDAISLVEGEDLVGDAVGQRLEQQEAPLGRDLRSRAARRRRSWSSRRGRR